MHRLKGNSATILSDAFNSCARAVFVGSLSLWYSIALVIAIPAFAFYFSVRANLANAVADQRAQVAVAPFSAGAREYGRALIEQYAHALSLIVTYVYDCAIVLSIPLFVLPLVFAASQTVVFRSVYYRPALAKIIVANYAQHSTTVRWLRRWMWVGGFAVGSTLAVSMYAAASLGWRSERFIATVLLLVGFSAGPIFLVILVRSMRINDPVADRKAADTPPWYYTIRALMSVSFTVATGILSLGLLVYGMVSLKSGMNALFWDDVFPRLQEHLDLWESGITRFAGRDRSWLEAIAADGRDRLNQHEDMLESVSGGIHETAGVLTTVLILAVGVLLLVLVAWVFYRETRHPWRAIVLLMVGAVLLDWISHRAHHVLGDVGWWSAYARFALVLAVFASGAIFSTVAFALVDSRTMCPWCGEAVKGTKRCPRCRLRMSLIKRGSLVGNAKARQIHARGCPFVDKIAAENRIEEITSLEMAYWNGFSNCKRCLH